MPGYNLQEVKYQLENVTVYLKRQGRYLKVRFILIKIV